MANIEFDSAFGGYELQLHLPANEDAWVHFTADSNKDRWSIETVEQVDGITHISGMTRNTVKLWGETYWFVLKLENQSAEIEYWLNRVVARTDLGKVLQA